MKSHATPEQESSTDHCSLITDHSAPTAFSFRSFQSDDMARAALMPGALLGWEPGLGKTMPAFAMPWLWRSAHTLIVVQADLHAQLIEEGREKFGVEVRVIDSQATALRFMREGILPMPGQQPQSSTDHCSLITDHSASKMPAYFITAYNWLGFNGADEWEADKVTESIRNRRLHIAASLMGLASDDSTLVLLTDQRWKPVSTTAAHEVLGIAADATPAEVKAAYRTAAKLYHPDLHPDDMKATAFFVLINAAYEKMTGKDTRNYDVRIAEFAKGDPSLPAFITTFKEMEQGIGTTSDHGIKCVMAPTMASIIHSAFDCVVCDEAVAIKSGTAHTAEGVLRMASKHRLGLTGTPIKNKLPDIFFIASWVTGFNRLPTARFPYGNTTSDRATFSKDFGVMEENDTKAEKSAERGEYRSFIKTDPTQICNVHRLWRVLGPVLIRRRKDDIPGCDIVKKTIIPIHVMPGTRQKACYNFHVTCPPPHDSILAQMGMQLMCLRQAALHPANPQLHRPGQPSAVSTGIFTPKIAAVLKLATDLMAQGEQLVVASPFTEFSKDLAEILTKAGIPHLRLDGGTSPTRRGQLIKQFKGRQIPVLIVGIKGMASGHNLDCCHNIVLPGIEWALDLNRQIVDRVHRLTSKKDVSIYVVITKGTIDERLANVWQEKGDSSDLALDGRLIENDTEKMDAADFLRQAVADFDPLAATLCEDAVATQWHTTGSAEILQAYNHYKSTIPTPETRHQKPEPKNPIPSPRSIPSTSSSPQPKPRTIFEIMKQKREQQKQATAPEPTNIITFTPAKPAPRQLPIIKKKAATFPACLR